MSFILDALSVSTGCNVCEGLSLLRADLLVADGINVEPVGVCPILRCASLTGYEIFRVDNIGCVISTPFNLCHPSRISSPHLLGRYEN
jgi:hypothetical protein